MSDGAGEGRDEVVGLEQLTRFIVYVKQLAAAGDVDKFTVKGAPYEMDQDEFERLLVSVAYYAYNAAMATEAKLGRRRRRRGRLPRLPRVRLESLKTSTRTRTRTWSWMGKRKQRKNPSRRDRPSPLRNTSPPTWTPSSRRPARSRRSNRPR